MQRIKVLSLLLVILILVTCVGPREFVYAAGVKVEKEKPVVIVLDPGHGGSDGGACRRWGKKMYYEKNLNLVIAMACKQELEKYSGVKVYLTRSSDYDVSLSKRISIAKQRGADVFVCLHNNASESSKVHGACVFYPNSGMNASVGKKGKELAKCIENRLVKNCGLKDNGILYRNSENHERYPDKSAADYYQVIRGSKLAGFPAVIVEHAYISNSGDCKQFLGSSEKLRKLGTSDAVGIADYYGLVKNTDPVFRSATCMEDGTVKLRWKAGRYFDKQILYRRKSGQVRYTKMATFEDPQVREYFDESAEPGETYEYILASYYSGKHGYRYTGLTDIMELMIPNQKTETEETENSENPENPENPENTENPESSENLESSQGENS